MTRRPTRAGPAAKTGAAKPRGAKTAIKAWRHRAPKPPAPPSAENPSELPEVTISAALPEKAPRGKKLRLGALEIAPDEAPVPRPTRRARPTAGEAPLPTRAELRAYLASRTGRVDKSTIARHFGLNADQRGALRDLMVGLKAEGSAVPAGRRGIAAPPPPPAPVRAKPRREAEPDAPPPRRPRSDGRLPEMTVVEVTGSDADGETIAKPVGHPPGTRPPIIFMKPEAAGQPALGPGEKVLARLRWIGGDKYEGRTFKRIAAVSPRRVLGVFDGKRIQPSDRRHKAEWTVPPDQTMGAQRDEIVLAEPLPSAHLGPRAAKIVERLGPSGGAGSISLLCVHMHGIPDTFPPEAVAEAEAATGTPLGGREDLRNTPLITIDGEDARDFDDAVFAEPDGNGWLVIVAIADVAHYVRPGSDLDREAWTRGNSVYFPDRVIPMLPEALSNGWCSLKPEEERGCLFVEMRIGPDGVKHAHRFGRGLMRSAARLTYDEVQDAEDALAELPGGTRAHLYGAFRALLAARQQRGTLELDLPERKVILGEDGTVEAVIPRPRRDSHKLIEEFMVLANVCAAEELEHLHQPCVYRIHDRPSDVKLEGLRLFLGTLGLRLPPSNVLHPRDFSGVLEKVRDTPEERVVNEAVLRGQSQAAYAPENIGHFGLALSRYAHFTSPIRRYADLCVHRALITGLGLGKDGLPPEDAARLPDTAEHITATERRAALAERDAVDRYLAAYMSERIGQTFDVRISGVTGFGLFVTIQENGASGLVPLASLPDDRWLHEDAAHRLSGARTRLTFTLGDAAEAELVTADARTGSLQFRLRQGDPTEGRRRAPKGRSPRR